MENKKFKISYTKLHTFKTCPKQYEYKYIQGLQKKIISRSLQAGSHIHKLCELLHLYRSEKLLKERQDLFQQNMKLKPIIGSEIKELVTDDSEGEIETTKKVTQEDYDKWSKKSFDLWKDTLSWREYIKQVLIPWYEEQGEEVKKELGETYIQDLIKIMGQYEYYYFNDKLIPVELENEKEVSLGEYNGKEVFLKYIRDGIVGILKGEVMEYYLLEQKTFSTSPMTFEDSWLNMQTAHYIIESKKEGLNLKGVLWDNIKNVGPKEMKILKNGTYGKQDSQRTLFSMISVEDIMSGPDTVLQKAKEVFNEAHDLEISENYHNYLSRHITIFNEEAVKNILQDSEQTLNIITSNNVPSYRNMGWTCNFCPFKDLCKTEMIGEDTSLVKLAYENYKDN